MNKQELIEKLSTKTKATLSHADLERLVKGFMEEIRNAVAAGDTVQLIGLGTFKARNRNAKKTRNPKTGEIMDIPARKSPVFKAGSAFKKAINK